MNTDQDKLLKTIDDACGPLISNGQLLDNAKDGYLHNIGDKGRSHPLAEFYWDGTWGTYQKDLERLLCGADGSDGRTVAECIVANLEARTDESRKRFHNLDAKSLQDLREFPDHYQRAKGAIEVAGMYA